MNPIEQRLARLEARLAALEAERASRMAPARVPRRPGDEEEAYGDLRAWVERRRARRADPACRLASPSLRLFRTACWLALFAITATGLIAGALILWLVVAKGEAVWLAVVFLVGGVPWLLYAGWGVQVLWLLWVADPRTSERAREERSMTWSQLDWGDV